MDYEMQALRKKKKACEERKEYIVCYVYLF
jgi:hypothetical protein